MQILLAVVLCGLVAPSVYCQGAGRAIPIATENFVIDLFRQINPRISYDTTNFLVDFSGNFANCNFIGLRQHERVNMVTPEGRTIGVVQDYTRASETHTRAVDEYLRPVFEGWVYENAIGGAYGQIQAADRFGCSVRPGCNGDLSVACLFSPYTYGPAPTQPPRPTFPPVRPTTPRPPLPPITGEQRAVAFTKQQYDEAEFMTTQSWDRSHFLENLSGFETRCDMIDRPYHDFSYATFEAESRDREVIGLYGSAPNTGSTPEALMEILDGMKQDIQSGLDPRYERLIGFFDPQHPSAVNAKQVGCSLIPDCIYRGQMFVIVSCVFEI